LNRKSLNELHFELISEAKANARDVSQDGKRELMRCIGTNKAFYVLGADTEKRIARASI
jgi:hypothetical protein